MLRRFITVEGEIMADEEWHLRPVDRCFWCDGYLILVKGTSCPDSQGAIHEFVTVCNPRS